MKEAIANAGVFNLIIMFVIVLLALFIGSLSYSRAFKVKNKIVEEIEKDQGYTSVTETEINSWLQQIGYRVNTGSTKNTDKCARTVTGNGGKNGTLINIEGIYQYCVYEFDTCTYTKEGKVDSSKCGKYYRVITYMYLDMPIIGGLLRIPVNGETMIFNEVHS